MQKENWQANNFKIILVGGAYALYQEMKEMRDCDYKILQEILKLKKFHF